MPTFKNLNDVQKYIQSKINQTLKEEVAEAVKDTMSDAIDNSVYSVYSPKVYQRRLSGGFGDTQNMQSDLIDDGLLEVSNRTPLNNDYGISQSGMTLSEIILSGNGYMYHGGEYEQPREYIEATEEKLNETGAANKAMRKGLKAKGLTVK